MQSRIFGLLLLAVGSLANAQFVTAQQTVTLYSPWHNTLKQYDGSRAWFSFVDGVRGTENKQHTGGVWDLGYGNLLISNEDWFEVGIGDEERSVIKDLGELNWSDPFNVPALTPLPEVAPGQHRTVEVDSSADTHKKWAATNSIFAKAIAGHIYVVHIKRSTADLYLLFRVEHLEQQDNCVISWHQIPAPEQ